MNFLRLIGLPYFSLRGHFYFIFYIIIIIIIFAFRTLILSQDMMSTFCYNLQLCFRLHIEIKWTGVKIIFMLSLFTNRLQSNTMADQGSIRKKFVLYFLFPLWFRPFQTLFCSLLKHIAWFQVDLLGDEVDTLLNLLEKIYIALNHYSPVLKHYPGVRWITSSFASSFAILALSYKLAFLFVLHMFSWPSMDGYCLNYFCTSWNQVTAQSN